MENLTVIILICSLLVVLTLFGYGFPFLRNLLGRSKRLEVFEGAYNGLAHGFVLFEKHGDDYQVVFINEAFYVQADTPEWATSGCELREVLQDFSGEKVWPDICNALDRKESATFEVVSEREGQKRWFDFKLSLVEDDADERVLFVGVSTETTNIKEREAEISHTQKLDALGKLAAGVAHDFNNVLSIIDGYSRIALNDLEEGSSAKDYIEKIRSASMRGSDLTKKMLTFSRHKIVVEDVIDLGHALEEQKVLLQALVDGSVTLSVHAEDREIFVECAPDSIMQILMNLVVNARDAMPEGGNVMVEARKVKRVDAPLSVQKEMSEDNFVCLSVTDSGHGIDSETLEHIFDPFFTTKGQGKGTGLGLSMVYGLVTQIGGYIDVQTAVNEGTIFSVYFSLSKKRPKKQIDGDIQDVESISLKGYTALIAEDEPDLLSIVGDMLEKLGMEVITASNGNEALLKQDEYVGDIDLLLTDVVMPDLDGVKLAELFTSLRPDSKIVFMSGYPADEKLSRVELPDSSLFVAKPIRYESLVQIIFGILSGNQTLLSSEATPYWKTSGVA